MGAPKSNAKSIAISLMLALNTNNLYSREKGILSITIFSVFTLKDSIEQKR
jgi:hypothetical protein